MTNTKTAPYFSIIIPCLNEEKYLPLLLRDLSSQTFTDFEVFVVDGSSDDNTPALTSSFPATYPLTLISTTRRNVSHQRNLGAQQSGAQILVFFDADTQIPKHYLEKIHHAYQTKRPHLLNTHLCVDSNQARDQWFPAFTNVLTEIGRIIKIPAAYGAALTIKRTVFEDIGGFDEKTSFAEDSQLFQTALDYNYKYIILPTPKYVFSLRRLRAEGALDTMYQYARLNFSVLMNGHHGNRLKYAMGGHVHQSIPKPAAILRRFDAIMNHIEHTTISQSKKITDIVTKFLPERKQRP